MCLSGLAGLLYVQASLHFSFGRLSNDAMNSRELQQSQTLERAYLGLMILLQVVSAWLLRFPETAIRKSPGKGAETTLLQALWMNRNSYLFRLVVSLLLSYVFLVLMVFAAHMFGWK
jgi:hypothetical protein